MNWLAENVVGLLGVLGALTVAAVAVFKAKREETKRIATLEESRKARALDDLPDAVFIVASDQRILYANVQAVLMTKYHIRDLVGMNVNELIPPRFRKRHPTLIRGYQDSPRTRAMGTAGTELYMLDKRGDETRVLIYLKQQEPLDNGPETLVVMRNFHEQERLLDFASRSTHGPIAP